MSRLLLILFEWERGVPIGDLGALPGVDDHVKTRHNLEHVVNSNCFTQCLNLHHAIELADLRSGQNGGMEYILAAVRCRQHR